MKKSSQASKKSNFWHARTLQNKAFWYLIFRESSVFGNSRVGIKKWLLQESWGQFKVMAATKSS